MESFPVLQPVLLVLFLLVYVLPSYTIAIPAEMFDEQEPAQEFVEEDREL